MRWFMRTYFSFLTAGIVSGLAGVEWWKFGISAGSVLIAAHIQDRYEP